MTLDAKCKFCFSFENCRILQLFEIYRFSVAAAKWNYGYGFMKLHIKNDFNILLLKLKSTHFSNIIVTLMDKAQHPFSKFYIWSMKSKLSTNCTMYRRVKLLQKFNRWHWPLMRRWVARLSIPVNQNCIFCFSLAIILKKVLFFGYFRMSHIGGNIWQPFWELHVYDT